MTGYVLRRLAWAVLLLLAVSAVTFLVFYTLPSADPAALRAGRSASPELLARVRADLGLDQPVHEQYLVYMKGLVLHFDLGFSYRTGAPVRDEILERLPATVSLVAGALVVWLLIAIPAGIASALRPRTLLDRVTTAAAMLALSAPVYWLGLVALYLFADDIGVLPIAPGAGSYAGLTEDPGAWLGSLVLPWLVLAAGTAAVYTRFLRASLVEAMSQDHVRAARARGLSERRVVLGYGVRSALTPMVTLVGLDVGILLGGAILTESVFNVPGVGKLAVDAIERSNLPLIQGTVLLGALFIVVASLLVDLAYAMIDPRVRPS